MDKIVKIALALSVLTSSVYAHSIGVKELNYNIGTSAAYIDANAIGKDYNIFSSVNIPLYKYLGSSISLRTGKSTYDSDTYKYSDSYYGGGVDLFLRDSSLGKVGGSYYYTNYHEEVNLYTFKSFKYHYTSSSASLYGDYYYGNFTISPAIYWDEVDGHKGSETPFSLGAEWYVQDNTRLGVRYYRDNIGENQYTFALSYQPSFLHNTTEVSASFTSIESYRVYQLSLNYHFSTDVSLKSRDREYR
jgi:hypothetical protein